MIRGGKVIGEGGQGCIISPEIYSKDSAYVTKIAKEKDASEDYKISKALFKLDPNEKYGVYYRGLKKCDVTKADLNNEKIVADPDGRRCSQIASRIENEKFCSLTMPRFSQDLTQPLPYLNASDSTKFIRHIWSCVAFLHHNDFIHGDIKLENMALYNGHPAFFDWGWSFKINNAKIIDKVFNTFSNNSYWCPLLQKRPVEHPKKTLLFFNDVYLTAKAIIKLSQKFAIKDVYLIKMKNIMSNQSFFCEKTVGQIIDYIFV
jgi:serine/threonine protein kinase